MKSITFLLFAVMAGGISPLTTVASEPGAVTATLDVQHPGAEIGTNFSGLSFEASLLLPGKDGLRYFRPDNQPLINLFHTLNIRSLRIGGNTSDRNATRLPGPKDWDSLFAFAQAAQVKVIYCLQLYHGNPRVAVQTVKYIMGRYAPWVDGFSIGQEPSAYPLTAVEQPPVNEREPAAEKYAYPAYAQEWKQFADDIVAAVPQVKLCGPGVHDNAEWARQFIAEFGSSNHVSLITEHLYPGGASGQVPTPEIGREQMLGKGFVNTYQKLYAGFVPVAAASGLPYRLEEVNNYYNGGATNVSDTFASALWGLDFMYWWAEHGAAGLNFHTGDRVASGKMLQVCKYTAFYSRENGLLVRPLGYGLKAFAVGGHGRMIPATISNPENLNVSLYAVLGDDQNLYVSVINKQSGDEARSVGLTLRLDHYGFTTAETMSLTAPGNDIACTQGQTLGGAVIKQDGSWNGKWTPLVSPALIHPSQGIVRMEVPPASAWIIKLNPNRVGDLSGR